MKSARSLLAFLVIAVLFSLPTRAQQPDDFTIIVMPDVQTESNYYPDVLTAQTQWIVKSQAALNIQMVLGLGDIVNNGSQDSQWTNADAAYQVLDQANVPYLLAIGNHDYDNLDPSKRSAVGFNRWFGPGRYNGRPWYAGSFNDSNENFYGTWTINGKSYLFLMLEYVPRDAAVEWAESVVEANPDKEVIIATHSYMFYDLTRVDQCDTTNGSADNYGDKLWAKFVSQHANILMVLSGHVTSGQASRRKDLGVNLNVVNQIFSNYQTLPNGGDGWLRVMTFHPSTDTVNVQTYSPYLNSYMTNSANQFSFRLHAPKISATTGRISGRVREAGTCNDVASAQIAAGGQTVATDAKGRFTLTVPAGAYNVNASATDYVPSSASPTVYNGYSTDTNFYLAPSTPPECTLNTASPSATICTPQNNSTVASPVHVNASTTDSNLVTYVQLYVDGAKVITQKGGALSTDATMAAGSHRVTVQAKDSTGATFKATIYITVAGP
jgi:hypothetical protein